MKNHVFHTEEHICNIHIFLSKLISLSEIQLLVLGAISSHVGIMLNVVVSLREISKSVISKHKNKSYEPTVQI